ncbi:MAG TPA: hypothetical protein VE575_01185 [Acidimicrobiales bacterium]|nr:hypothetical protein [Acidimicrobiales bacterium]
MSGGLGDPSGVVHVDDLVGGGVNHQQRPAEPSEGVGELLGVGVVEELAADPEGPPPRQLHLRLPTRSSSARVWRGKR